MERSGRRIVAGGHEFALQCRVDRCPSHMGGINSDSKQCSSLKLRWLEAEVSLVGFRSSVPFSSCRFIVGTGSHPDGRNSTLLWRSSKGVEEGTGLGVVLWADTSHPRLLVTGYVVGLECPGYLVGFGVVGFLRCR